MKTSQILRISVALAIIFCAGLLTGRLTVPRPPIAMAAPGGKTVTSDTILTRVTAELSLDASQKSKMKTIIEELSELMAVIPPATVERRDLFRKSVPRMREVLRPDQFAAFDRYVEMTERHWARIIRRRESIQAQSKSDLPPPRPRPGQP